MIVFQLTLTNWFANHPTRHSEDCIKWVKAPSRESLDHWLGETGLGSLVEEIDTNPLPEYGFEDGVDVIVYPDCRVEFKPGTDPANCPETVRLAGQAKALRTGR